jgi:hypothetical protein
MRKTLFFALGTALRVFDLPRKMWRPRLLNGEEDRRCHEDGRRQDGRWHGRDIPLRQTTVHG